MNIALIIAGGSGQRMNQDIPKQFLNVNDKPVIIYTLEAFQRHPNIDKIEVVCLDGWQEILRENGQSSIRNGLWDLKEMYDENDLVLIHDAIRPMVSEEIISDAIRVCKKYGNSISVIPCAEAMLKTEDGVSSLEQIPRDNLKRTQTPQTFVLKDIVAAHEEALEKGITNSVASCTLYIELGKKLYFSAGSEKNIKLTTPDDIDIFKSLLVTRKSEWMK